MKPIRIVSWFGSVALVAVGALAMPGCSSTPSTGDGGGGDSGGMDAAKTDGGGDVMMQTVSCANYCSAFKTSCGTTNNAYPDDASCMAACMALPLGMASDTMTQSIGCRQYHAGAAASDMKTHCPHASAYGGGICGTECDSLCTIASKVCTGNLFPFTGMNDCLSKCGGWATTGMAGDTTGNTLQCREYHLLVAAQSMTNAMTHCAHVGDMSSTCR